ncbi:MAG: hypothetical protein N3D75_02710 [Candidatus Aenigmarchaeota archaeon]|nr:hypothetical protein [Candidatus Aenigmarchaeota archaeon]
MAKETNKIKYPKLTVLIFTIIVAVIIFYEGKNYDPFHDFIVSLGYIGTFIGGFFYAYGFTSAPATAVLLVLSKEQILVLATLVGGLGAVISDYLIFRFVRHSFMDEIDNIKNEKMIKTIIENGKRLFGKKSNYVIPVIAGFLIASPLPTEIGVSLLASSKNINTQKFLIIAFILHSLGIFAILSIGNFI